MNPSRYFTVAEYAFTKINPFMGEMNAKLIIHLSFGPHQTGVDLYVHRLEDSKVIHHKIAITTLDQVDAFVTQMLVQASIAA